MSLSWSRTFWGSSRRVQRAGAGGSHRSESDTWVVASLLFVVLFTAQAAVIVLSPVLGAVASEFHVSTAAAGQLRTLSGLAAAATALLVPRLSRRFGLRALLLWGSTLIAAASVASACAPSFAVLAAAQIVVGAGVATLLAAATTAAAAWVPDDQRAKVLSWALIGQPAAWIVGMPLIGALGERSWRLAWLALPLVAAGVAIALVVRRHSDVPGPALDSGSARRLQSGKLVAGRLRNCSQTAAGPARSSTPERSSPTRTAFLPALQASPSP